MSAENPRSPWLLGLSTGLTVFGIVVPATHLIGELAAHAGVVFGAWSNPVGIFVFLITTGAAGMPWGLWIIFTDARTGKAVATDREVNQYLLAAASVFFTFSVLSCTQLQSVYGQFRWFLTPAIAVSALALLRWRWTKVWGFPTKVGLREALACAFGGAERT